jgi:hypothetical protein
MVSYQNLTDIDRSLIEDLAVPNSSRRTGYDELLAAARGTDGDRTFLLTALGHTF